jgi:hypothetical protein
MAMTSRLRLLALAALALPLAGVHALTPPSESDGPVRLLNCIVTPQGALQAEVDSQSDDVMMCSIRCSYELGDQKFSHTFRESIPARFQGRVGRFDTGNARAGNYSGDVSDCKKVG